MSNQIKNPFISIIIPVYNVEPYIERCFRSVVFQTYRNYECIFVDDCGTDKSIKILQKLIDEYNGEVSIRLLGHEKNQGLSASRNTGMQNAKGEYFYFVDSDDYIFDNALEQLIMPLQNRKYDLISGRSKISKNNLIYLSKIQACKENQNNIEYFHQSLANMMGMGGSVCNHLYSKSFLEIYKINFIEGVLFEDILFNAECFCHNPLFIELDSLTYFYEIHNNSITTRKSERHYVDEIRGVEILEQIISKNNISDSIYAARLIEQRFLRLLIISPNYGKEYFKRTFDYIRKRGVCKKTFSLIPFRHKLLYIQGVMPKYLAYFYVRCFVWMYRTFIGNV